MLVYANALRLEGSDAFAVASHAIHGWLSDQLGERLAYDELLRPNEWNSNKARRAAWLRSYVSAGQGPEMYAWVLKHADDNTRGRQWLVELGLRCDPDIVEFSCTIQTEELSVLVTDPVQATRPRLIRYLLKNLRDGSGARLAPDVPGTALRTVGPDIDSYRALLATIDDPGRDYPLVLVSPDREGKYLVDPTRLQEATIGLAQIVKIDANYNSYEMEQVLGKPYSAWDGSLNLVQIPNQRGIAYAHYFVSEDIEGWGDAQTDRVSRVLAHVTHNTNVPRLRRRIRSDGVLRLAMRRRMATERQKLRDNPGADKDVVKLYEDEIDALNSQLSELQRKLDDVEIARLDLEDTKQQLEYELRTEKFNHREQLRQAQSTQGAQVDPLLLMRMAGQAGQPSPLDCLEVIGATYPERVVILDSALDSAAQHQYFTQGCRLLDMLRRLCTDYVDQIQTGGDDAARKIFTDKEYAANESEGTQKNKQMRQARTFQRNGQSIEMWRHLKIGVADDQRKSIRVYFEWLPDEHRIVIGHCGVHLPVINH